MDPRRTKRAEGVTAIPKDGRLPPEGAKLLARWTKADLVSFKVDVLPPNAPSFTDLAA
jgi:hypothetical protein